MIPIFKFCNWFLSLRERKSILAINFLEGFLCLDNVQ